MHKSVVRIFVDSIIVPNFRIVSLDESNSTPDVILTFLNRHFLEFMVVAKLFGMFQEEVTNLKGVVHNFFAAH